MAPFEPQPMKVITALAPGEVSELVQRERNLYIFHLRDREEVARQT